MVFTMLQTPKPSIQRDAAFRKEGGAGLFQPILRSPRPQPLMMLVILDFSAADCPVSAPHQSDQVATRSAGLATGRKGAAVDAPALERICYVQYV